MSSTEDAPRPAKKPRKRFVWFSAISLGAVFSAATFNLGVGTTDELLVALGLRTVVATGPFTQIRLGDYRVSVAEVFVENFPEDGVPYRSVRRAVIDGRQVEVTDNDGFRHHDGMAISDGSYLQGWVDGGELAEAREIHFCNVTARYVSFIPLYHYHVGISYGPVSTTRIERSRMDGIGPALLEKIIFAGHLAQDAGWDRSGEIFIENSRPHRSLDSGLTMRWSFCDRLEPYPQALAAD